jgi:glycosyltransferase involved in cell wall biosynthesis
VAATLPVNKAQFLDPRCWQKIYRTCRQQGATHLVLEFPYYGLAGVLCKKWLRLNLVVHAHNMEALRFREQKKWWWRALLVLEKWTLKNADAVFYKTEKDRQTAEQVFGLKGKKSVVIPYGIVRQRTPDKAAAKQNIYQRHGIPAGTRLLLFAGTLDYGPNATAVENIEKKLIPLLQKREVPFMVIFCGRIVYEAFAYLKGLQNKHLVYAGNVPDIENYFAAADVFLNPVVVGGGVQTKVVDALNFHLNVVCFETMTEGITGADAKLFTAPAEDWEQFAEATIRAAENGNPTPALFFEHHDWNKIAEKALHLIQNT